MPKAVASNSIAAPPGQPTFSTDLDAFHDTIRQLEALHMMLGSALIDGGLGSSSDGAYRLRRRQTLDLWQFYEAVKSDLARLREEQPSPYATRHGRVAQTGMLLTSHIIRLVETVWTDAGLDQAKTEDASWQETRRGQIVNLAQTYRDMVMDRLQDKADQIEAGSYLPWIEAKARKQLERETVSKPQNRPMLMRDQFIAESIRNGDAVGDIAQALGLSTVAVDRAIRRLRAGRDQEGDKATA